MIIGLTGKNGAGKGMVSDYLKGLGFAYHSLSDVIRAEIRKDGQAITREALIAKGRALRQGFGPKVLAELVLQQIPSEAQVIVDSIRNPYEVEAFRARRDFVLIAVDADQRLRFERCRQRGRENDSSDFLEFVRLENEELSSSDPTAQQLLATNALADYVIQNDTDKAHCYQQIDAILNKVRGKL